MIGKPFFAASITRRSSSRDSRAHPQQNCCPQIIPSRPVFDRSLICPISDGGGPVLRRGCVSSTHLCKKNACPQLHLIIFCVIMTMCHKARRSTDSTSKFCFHCFRALAWGTNHPFFLVTWENWETQLLEVMKTEKLISDPTLFFQEKKHVVNSAFWPTGVTFLTPVLGQLWSLVCCCWRLE